MREAPDAVLSFYLREIAAGVDVLAALTTETTPRSLGQIGMAFRAAALTGAAIDLAQEAAQQAPRLVAVAGVLGHTTVREPDRIAEEYATHAARLVAAGCEIILSRGASEPGLARLARIAAVGSAAATELPTWVVLELDAGLATVDGQSLDEAASSATAAGAQAILVEVASADAGRRALGRARALGVPLGVLLATRRDEDAWVADLRGLVDEGARVIGGGAGTELRHVAALARALGRSEGSSSIWPRAV